MKRERRRGEFRSRLGFSIEEALSRKGYISSVLLGYPAKTLSTIEQRENLLPSTKWRLISGFIFIIAIVKYFFKKARDMHVARDE